DSLSDAGVLAGQKWLAQMAFLLRDNVADRSTVVAAPPRDFTPTRQLVDAIIASKSFVSLTTLDGLVKNPRTQKVATRQDVVPTPTTPDIGSDVVRSAVDGVN